MLFRIIVLLFVLLLLVKLFVCLFLFVLLFGNGRGMVFVIYGCHGYYNLMDMHGNLVMVIFINVVRNWLYFAPYLSIHGYIMRLLFYLYMAVFTPNVSIVAGYMLTPGISIIWLYFKRLVLIIWLYLAPGTNVVAIFSAEQLYLWLYFTPIVVKSGCIVRLYIDLLAIFCAVVNSGSILLLMNYEIWLYFTPFFMNSGYILRLVLQVCVLSLSLFFEKIGVCNFTVNLQ